MALDVYLSCCGNPESWELANHWQSNHESLITMIQQVNKMLQIILIVIKYLSAHQAKLHIYLPGMCTFKYTIIPRLGSSWDWRNG